MGKSAREDQRAAERAARAEAARRAEVRRRRRPLLIAGALIAVAAVVILVVVALSGGGGGSASTLPVGTKVFTEANHQHVQTHVTYDHTPPAGGAHNPIWLNCGIYSQPVPNENAVHDLEHGAVWVTYRPDLPSSDVSRLQQFVQNHYDGNELYLVLSPYPGLPAPVVATAWGAQIQLTGPGDPKLAPFIAHYIGGGQGGEKGSPCTGGTGKPA
jgi:hypothetical protein